MCDSIDYPVHLLPEKGWCKPIPVKAILEWDEKAGIGRRLDGEKQNIVYHDSTLGKEILSAELIDPHLRCNISTSLLGAAHRLIDFKFRQIGNGQKPWDSSTEVILQNFKYGTDFNVKTEEFHIAIWEVAKIHGMTIPYSQEFNNSKDLQKRKDIIPQDKIISVTVDNDPRVQKYLDLQPDNSIAKYVIEAKGKTEINHDPTNLNYWHFTIDIYPPENETVPIMNTKSAARKSLANAFWDILRRQCTVIHFAAEYPERLGWQSLCRS